MRDDRKGFSAKDIIIIILCIIVLIVLVVLLKQSRTDKQAEQEQLAQLQEEINETGTATTTESTQKQSVAALELNEINQEGWLEVYNGERKSEKLTGASVYVDGELVKSFEDEYSIPSKSLLVLELGKAISQKDNTVVSLIDSNGEQIFTAVIPELGKGQSYGRIGNGNAKMGYQTPTKGADNEIEALETDSVLSFSVPGGFYSETVQLELTTQKGMEIYYTLDGSTPTTASEKYTEPIKISNRSGSNYVYGKIVNNGYVPSSITMGTVVRAIAVNASGNTQAEGTQSYFIGIQNNSDLADLPVISVTTDGNNLFDYHDGIYVQGEQYENALVSGYEGVFQANYQMDWQRDAHIEFFESNKDKSYEGDLTLSILRDYSMETPQKSFTAYGDGSGAWSGSTLNSYFNSVSNTLEILTNRRDNDSKAREYLVNDLLQETSVGTQDMEPCVLFINGEYWGGYMLRKPIDHVYFEEHYDIGTDETVIVAQNGNIDNSEYRDSYDQMLAYVTQNDMSIDSNYTTVQSMMDVQSYLDYLCANMYIANVDYGEDDAYVWKTAEIGTGKYSDGKWRWIIGKTNCSMNVESANGKATNTINSFLMEMVREDTILRSLIRNDSFKQQLSDTMHQMAEEVFTTEKVTAELKSLTELLAKMAANSYERFFAYPKTDFYSGKISIIQTFFDGRAEFILDYADNIEETEKIWNSIEQGDVSTPQTTTQNVTAEQTDATTVNQGNTTANQGNAATATANQGNADATTATVNQADSNAGGVQEDGQQ